MMDSKTLLVIVCSLAILAAAGVVSQWMPFMAPILSMLASSVLAAGIYAMHPPMTNMNPRDE